MRLKNYEVKGEWHKVTVREGQRGVCLEFWCGVQGSYTGLVEFISYRDIKQACGYDPAVHELWMDYADGQTYGDWIITASKNYLPKRCLRKGWEVR